MSRKSKGLTRDAIYIYDTSQNGGYHASIYLSGIWDAKQELYNLNNINQVEIKLRQVHR